MQCIQAWMSGSKARKSATGSEKTCDFAAASWPKFYFIIIKELHLSWFFCIKVKKKIKINFFRNTDKSSDNRTDKAQLPSLNVDEHTLFNVIFLTSYEHINEYYITEYCDFSLKNFSLLFQVSDAENSKFYQNNVCTY